MDERARDSWAVGLWRASDVAGVGNTSVLNGC